MPTIPQRIELPFVADGGTVNVYLFTEPEAVLIDAGFHSPPGWAALEQGLAAHGVTVADLARVLITHPHVDHYGLAARIARESQAEIWMSAVGVHWLRDFPTLWQRRIDYYHAVLLPGLGLPRAATERSLGWMQHTLAAWEPIPRERIVAFDVGQPLWLGGQAWQPLHLPGHDSHLTCFYQPESRQFLGSDMLIIPTATPVVEAPPAGTPRNPALPRFLQSLQRLAELPIDQVYPGHGQPFANASIVIHSQQTRIQERKEECLRAIAGGAETATALFAQLYGPRPVEASMAGLWMLLGYLDLLIAEGRVAMHEEEGVWHYRKIDD